MKMIRNTALAAKRKGGGPPVPGMNAPAPAGGLPPAGGAPGALPPGMAKGGCVKMAAGGSASRGYGAARSSANKYRSK